jgi:hypothetical protein
LIRDFTKFRRTAKAKVNTKANHLLLIFLNLQGATMPNGQTLYVKSSAYVIIQDTQGNRYWFNADSGRVKVGLFSRDRLVKASVSGALQSAHQKAYGSAAASARYWNMKICSVKYTDSTFF